MNKMIVAATLLALAGVNLQTAKAGDCGWATAGKILTGVAAGVVIANALDCQPAYYPVTYSRCAPAPVVYVPAPVVVYPRPVFITLRPLVNVNYRYRRGHPGRGHGHDYRR